MKKTETKTLIYALLTLSAEIYPQDGVANAAIKEGANRLEQFRATLEAIRETGEASLAASALDPGPEGRGEEPLPW